MTAVWGFQVSEFGGPDVLNWSELPGPEVRSDEVLVDVAYSGVNFLDIHQRSGKYPRPVPFVPGNEGSGHVAAVGPEVSGFRPGDRVAFAMHGTGSYAERVAVPADRLVHVPESIRLADAAALVLQGVTAICLVHVEARLRKGTTVLVHSISGGAGGAVAQIARHAGASVLGLTSSQHKREIALRSYADDVLLYDERGGGYAEWVRERSGGGADAVFNAMGGDSIHEDIRSLALRGHVVLYGQTSGPFTAISPGTLSERSLTVTYSRVSAYLTEPGSFARYAGQLLAIAVDGGIAPAMLTELPADRAPEAHRALADRSSTGKTILRFHGG